MRDIGCPRPRGPRRRLRARPEVPSGARVGSGGAPGAPARAASAANAAAAAAAAKCAPASRVGARRSRTRPRAAWPALRVQRPPGRDGRRWRPARGPADGGRAPKEVRRVEWPPARAPRLAARGAHLPGPGRHAASKGAADGCPGARAPRAASRTARRPGLTHPVSSETTLHANLPLCGDSQKNKHLPITLARALTSGAALAPQSAADTSYHASRTGQDTRHGSPRHGRVRRRSLVVINKLNIAAG